MIDEPWPDVKAYASKLGVSWTWVRDKVTARQIHVTFVGRYARFSPEDQEANRLMWATAPIKTPSAVLLLVVGGPHDAPTWQPADRPGRRRRHNRPRTYAEDASARPPFSPYRAENDGRDAAERHRQAAHH